MRQTGEGRPNRRQLMQLAGAGLLAGAAQSPRRSGGKWVNACSLDSRRRLTSGSPDQLAAAIRRGADLRIQTEFRHNEHIDTKSTNPELIREVAEFAVTYLVDDRWTAGIMSLRQPISLPDGFGPRPSMSFFLYNQDGGQAIARPYLDGGPVTGKMGASALDDHSDMLKYHQFDAWDSGTNAPSSNFVYDFEVFKFFVDDEWEEALSHDGEGRVKAGSVEKLAEAFSNGRDIKIGVAGICQDLAAPGAPSIRHELFSRTGSGYYYTKQKLFIAGSHPVVRVAPGIPMRYRSQAWDFGWLMARTDGRVESWLVDPYTLKFRRSSGHYPIRWFVS
ncbi:MAG: hypothetical protein ACE15E_03030 [Acidobacteriota bacterium]